MNNKYKVYALFGKSGAGKDAIQKWMTSNFPSTTKGIVSCTTRQKRDRELNGIDYYFLTKERFIKEIEQNNMLEYTQFNNWYYGTRIYELDANKINIGVFNIGGIKSLLQDPRIEVKIFYIDASDKTRLIRALEREDQPNCHEICRRFLADEQDFLNIDFSYETILNNGDFSYTKEQLSKFF